MDWSDAPPLSAGKAIRHRRLPEVRYYLVLLGAPLLMAAGYGLLLGHRDDYLGHYLAGCGATLGAITLGLGLLIAIRQESLAPAWIAGTVLVCIALGAVCEATLYRIAKFDEVDFCNQSLGAVLAGAVSMFNLRRRGMSELWVWVELVWAATLVVGGYYFAFR